MYTQDQIIEAMEMLGYKDVDENGVCFGITHMMIQAILIGQRKEFEDRIRLILDEPDLKIQIDRAKNRVKKLKKGEKPSPEDRELLEILSFFDGIMLYHEALKSSEWFSKNITQDEPLEVSPFVQPPALADEGGIVAVYSGSGIYTEGDLSSYLNQLAGILGKPEDHDKIAVQISCLEHAMLLTYNAKNNQWNFFNPNQLLKEPVSAKEIAGAIMAGFSEGPITAFNTKVYTTKNYDDRYNVKEQFHVLHQIKEHKINETRAKMKTNEDVTWLWIAAEHGHLEVIQELLEKGALVNLPDKDGWTALHIAAQNGHLEVVKFLLKKGASVDWVNNDGDGVLHIAAENGQLGVVQILLENGALVNSEDSNKWTALHIAAHNGCFEIVKFLLEKGALANLIDKDENTALYQAAKNGHFKVVEALVEKGAMINMTNSHGWTALHFAVLKNELEIVKYLIKKGAKIDLIDKYEKTVLELAEAQDHPDIVNVIKNAIASSTKKSEPLPLFKLSSSLQKKNNENEENKENTSPKSPNSTY